MNEFGENQLSEDSINRFVFHPRKEPFNYSPTGILTTTSSGSELVCGYLHINPDSNTLILFFHGNGEIAADYDSLAPLYTSAGSSFWVLDYRGYGRSTGMPSLMNIFTDAEAVLADVPRLAQKVGQDFEQILIMGRSLGSAPAIHLASTHSRNLAGLVLDSPFANSLDLIRRLGGPRISPTDLPGFEDNLDKIRNCRLPTLIIHGANDQIIPVSESRALYASSPASHKKLLIIENAGHNDLLWVGLEEYSETLIGFIRKIIVK